MMKASSEKSKGTDTTDGIQWEKLLEKTRDPGALLPEELSFLISGFLPRNPPATRSKAYLILSSFCQGVRSSSTVKGRIPDSATETLVRCFGPLTVSRLSDTEESTLLAGVSFLTALFHVDWESASSIFQENGVLEAIMDSVDLGPSDDLSLSVAQLLAQACGHKGCRSILSSQSLQWLEHTSHTSRNTRVRAGATNALIKLSKGSATDNPGASGAGTQAQGRKNEDVSLAAAMKEIIISSSDIASSTDAIEGLAYLSVDPVIKDTLSRDSKFLQQLFSFLPSRKVSSTITPTESISTVVFGILVIVVNLCTYRPHVTEEQAQIEKLRRIAQTGNDPAKFSSASAFDDDEHVKTRVRRLIDAGVLDILSTAVRTDSSGIRINIGKALRSIAEDKENRGRVLQSGGAKVLITVLKHATMSSNASGEASVLNAAYLDAIQALAKLAITASPIQVFGPDEGVMHDVIRPFSSMLQHPSSTLLQRFESMMALTNLSSQSAEVASRIAQAEGLLAKVEFLLLEEHILVRRAAMELLCNLIVGSDTVFEKYGGERNLGSAKSKLQIILALSDVDDLPTRLAAAGALATLTAAAGACQVLVTLQLKRHRVLPILAQLIDPLAARSYDTNHAEVAEYETHPGLVHRGVICARNIVLNIGDEGSRRRLAKEAKDTGLLQGLTNIVKAQVVDEAILRPTAEALKVLLDNQN